MAKPYPLAAPLVFPACYDHEHVYHGLARMALAAGWRREGGAASFWWRHPTSTTLRPCYTLGEVIEKVLRDHGVDLRQSVPDEEEA